MKSHVDVEHEETVALIDSLKLSLRDQFAMAALQGMLASDSSGALSPVNAATAAYCYATEMLKARANA